MRQLGLLFLPVLRPRAALFQKITAAALSLFQLATIIRATFPRLVGYRFIDLFNIAVALLAPVVVVMIPLAAYFSLRRRIPFTHQPPADVQTVVALTCPRCNTAQSIAPGGGQCAACRLQIFIALSEGRCKTCNYPLRQLTGDKCPECGTPFTPPDPDHELLAWAAANDRSRPVP